MVKIFIKKDEKYVSGVSVKIKQHTSDMISPDLRHPMAIFKLYDKYRN